MRVFAAILAFVMSGAVQSRADDHVATAASSSDADACFSAAERAQPLLRQKRLREAKALLQICARDACPRAARTDCVEWLAEATDAQPTILITAHEIVGGGPARDLHGVRAIIDETLVFDHAEASPLLIDPGRHRIRLERAGEAPLEQDVNIREGDTNRVIDFTWRDPAAAIPPLRPVPASVYISGALGAAALGVGAALEASGLSERAKLGSTCQATRTCAQSDVDAARTTTRAGDITIGASALLIASAVVLYFTRPAVHPPSSDVETSWILSPVPGGLVGGFKGSL